MIKANKSARRAAELQLRQEFLSAVPLVQSLPAAARRQIAEGAAHEWYEPDELIIEQGDDDGESMFFLRHGAAVAVRNGVVVREYGPYDYFGELAILSKSKRLATVKGEAGFLHMPPRRSLSPALSPALAPSRRCSEKPAAAASQPRRESNACGLAAGLSRNW